MNSLHGKIDFLHLEEDGIMHQLGIDYKGGCNRAMDLHRSDFEYCHVLFL